MSTAFKSIPKEWSRSATVALTIATICFLFLEPAGAVWLCYAHWAAGYRTADWLRAEGWAAFAVFPLMFVLAPAFVAFSTAPVTSLFKRGRPVYATCLFSLVLLELVFCLWAVPEYSRGIFDWGRHRLLKEIGAGQLASDCMSLYARPPAGIQSLLGADFEKNAAVPRSVRRLRPAYIMLTDDGIRIELHGGFAHYGYQCRQDKKSQRWIMVWFSEDAMDEPVVSIPDSGLRPARQL
jgi:hypothetical protein